MLENKTTSIEFDLNPNFINIATFLGIASYSIEGICLLFTLRSDFIKDRSKQEFKELYFGIFIFVILLYIIFGIINYADWGSQT